MGVEKAAIPVFKFALNTSGTVIKTVITRVGRPALNLAADTLTFVGREATERAGNISFVQQHITPRYQVAKKFVVRHLDDGFNMAKRALKMRGIHPDKKVYLLRDNGEIVSRSIPKGATLVPDLKTGNLVVNIGDQAHKVHIDRIFANADEAAKAHYLRYKRQFLRPEKLTVADQVGNLLKRVTFLPRNGQEFFVTATHQGPNGLTQSSKALKFSTDTMKIDRAKGLLQVEENGEKVFYELSNVFASNKTARKAAAQWVPFNPFATQNAAGGTTVLQA